MGKLLVLVFSHVMVNFVGGCNRLIVRVGLMYLQPTDGGGGGYYGIAFGCVEACMG